MAQDIDKVIDLLNDIKKTNNSNADSFDRLLSAINSKLDMSAQGSVIELLKACTSELSNLFDDKYSNTLVRIEDIEKALKAIYDSLEIGVKGADLKELFDVLSKNINNFYSEARQQKAIIAGIETKISDLSSNKTDKDDILRTISLLRNDFGTINSSYKTSFDDINSSLKSIISTIKSIDPLKNGETVIAQIDIMFKSIHEIASLLQDIRTNEENLENLVAKVVTNEDLKVTHGVIESIVEKTKDIEGKLELNAQRQDISDLQKSIDFLYNNSSSKDDAKNLSLQAENILSQAEEIKQSLSEVAQHIENIPDATDLSNGLMKLYDQIDRLNESITGANTNEDISAEIKNLNDEIDTIKNIIADLSEVLSAKISKTLDNSSFTDDFIAGVKNLINDLPCKDDIEKIIENSKILNEINKNTTSISEQLNILPVIKENVEDIINKLPNIDIKDELSTIYNKTNSIENWLIESHSKENSDTGSTDTVSGAAFDRLHKKLDTLRDDVDELKDNDEKVLRNNSDIENNIALISDFVKNNSTLDEEYIKSEFSTIKSMIESCAQDFDNFDSENQDLVSIKEYLAQIKELINLNANEKLYGKLLNIEDTIVNNHTFNESAFSQVIEKINNLKSDRNQEADEQIAQAISELSALQGQIQGLQESFSSKNSEISENPVEKYCAVVEEFLSDKLSDINNNITNITNCTGSKLDNGFAYQSDLLEQKTAKLQELIEQLIADKNPAASEVNEKLLNANDVLDDFRRELQFVSTDINEGINKCNTQILDEITPIKDILSQISESISSNSIKNDVENLNESLVNAPELSEIRNDIEDLYGRLTEKFIENENNLKDFVLTDTDSIIIKLDNLKDYVEESLNSFIPPDVGNMKELNDFVNNINDFKDSLAQLLTLTADEIKREIAEQSKEIKSMIAVANNHDDIISAIDELKKCFKNKKQKDVGDGEAIQQIYNVDDDSILQLKDEFDKYSKQIEKLSNDNSQICSVLDSIKQKLEVLSLPNQSKDVLSAGSEITDDFEITDEDIFGQDKFDFVQAFDLLQHDISALRNSIDEVKNKDNASSKIPSVNNSGMLINVNSKLDELLKSVSGDWLSDVQKYIENSNLSMKNKLDSIESKLDVFVSDTTNSDLLNEVSDTLNDVTDTLNGVSDSINGVSDSIAEIAPHIGEILTESDKKLSSMLEELNQKIGLIKADSNSSDELEDIKSLIGEQKTYIENLEPSEKLDAFKKCLDEISFEVNALATDSNADNEKLDKTIKEMKESLMSAVVTIFDQVSFVEESEDIKDFVEERTDEINQNIALITQQLKQITSSDDSQNYIYSMQDIESDLANLRLALKELHDNKEPEKSMQIDFSEITDKLHSINSSVDLLTQDEIKDLKSEISALKEQTQFLIASSDKSYDAINTGIEGFGEKFNENLTVKVDKLSKMLENSAESDRVIKQALIYMGEWIDSASKSINKISSNSEEISSINNVLSGIQDLKKSISANSNDEIEQKLEDYNRSIEALETKISKFENLEAQIASQQERIDRLEKNIDKILTIVENIEDPSVSRKIDKMEKHLSKLGTHIEKLASYVD